MSGLRPSDRAPNLWTGDDVRLPDDAHVGAHVVLHSHVEVGAGCWIEDGAVVGKLPRPNAGSTSPEPAPGRTVLGPGTLVGSHAVVCAGVVTGKDVFIGDHTLIREGARLGDGTSIGHAGTVGRDCRLGARVRTQGYVALATGVVIEDDVFLGPLTAVLGGLTLGATDPGAVGGPAVLRAGSHLGSGAHVLPGLVIGEGAVVGAGSVVTRDVPPGGRVRGAPARSSDRE